ncbi:MAG TPA: aminopeptidase P family N-terminal domain-containing protein, partial [Desulfuromonadales bacterium]
MRITPASELQARFQKLQSLMQKEGLDAVLITQSADLFYFTGSIQQGLLYIPAGGEPVYMVRKE